MNKLYDDKAFQIMKITDKSSSSGLNRLEKIRAFALEGKYKTIGIAYCITFSREVSILKKYFEKSFKVYAVDCKYGRLISKDLLGGHSSRVLCNPAGQAQYLNDKKTDLNISIGLCVGHDMIFNKQSLAPVTCVYTKDSTNNNNMDKAVQEISKQLLIKE